MRTGRKILNLRHDRSITQQDLARLCEITPSALSKIEAGINSPRANIIARIAGRLGVTMEYLLDEELPYPYKGFNYRQRFLDDSIDPDSAVRTEVTHEERAFLEALRASPKIVREMAYALPEVSMESIRLAHFVLKNTCIDNPTPVFLEQFERLLTTGAPFAAEPAPEPPAPRTRKPRGAKKKAAGKKATSKKAAGKKATSKKASAKKKKGSRR
jgi:transcriptional regulator with XRE-family HTH domain